MFQQTKRDAESSIVDPSARSSQSSAARGSWMRQWMSFLRTVGNIQAWVLLSVFYVVIITPIGFCFRFFADPLRLRRRGSTWQPFIRQYDRMDEARSQA